MLLSLAVSSSPGMPDARDVGFLLAKHPDRVQSFEVPQARATVLFPEASPARTELALLLDVDRDAVAAAWRGRGEALAAYVNDRPYAAGSLLGAALSKVFRTALNGRCEARPDLLEVTLPLEVRLPALRARGGPSLAFRLFDALGWETSVEEVELPGLLEDSPIVSLSLRGSFTLQAALSHLAHLLPALDGGHVHFVTADDAERLARTAPWLAEHPDRLLLLRRLLAGQADLVASACEHLGVPAPAPRATLADVRIDTVVSVLEELGVSRVADLGCGEGGLLTRLARSGAFSRVVGADVSPRVLSRAARRLEDLEPHERRRVRLLQSSVTVPDSRITADAAVLVEVVEHLDADRLLDLESAVFSRFDVVVLTTPNREYNPLLGSAASRHADHRFEWTRAECVAWADGVASRHGFTVEHRTVGPVDPVLGSPTQLVTFRRAHRSSSE